LLLRWPASASTSGRAHALASIPWWTTARRSAGTSSRSPIQREESALTNMMRSHARADRREISRSIASRARCFQVQLGSGAYGTGLRKLAIIGNGARSGADSPAEK
jgi:hypothetical protein